MSNGMPQMPTWRHHYIPEFYLKRWALGGGRQLVQFSRPNPNSNEVKALRVYPRQTGFVDKLYALRGLPLEQASRIEERYFRPVDTDAAMVLNHFEAGVNSDLSERERTAWTQFVLTLLLRMPEELAAAKAMVLSEWWAKADHNERRYQKLRRQSDPQTWADFVRLTPQDELDRTALSSFIGAMNFRKCGEHLNNMVWGSFRFPWHVPALMTSDRPLLIEGGLSDAECRLFLPTGPKTLFYAVNSKSVENCLKGYHAATFGEHVNLMVVSRAHRFAYGTTDRNIEFVRQYLATNKAPVMAAQAADRLRTEDKKKTLTGMKKLLVRN